MKPGVASCCQVEDAAERLGDSSPNPHGGREDDLFIRQTAVCLRNTSADTLQTRVTIYPSSPVSSPQEQAQRLQPLLLLLVQRKRTNFRYQRTSPGLALDAFTLLYPPPRKAPLKTSASAPSWLSSSCRISFSFSFPFRENHRPDPFLLGPRSFQTPLLPEPRQFSSPLRTGTCSRLQISHRSKKS